MSDKAYNEIKSDLKTLMTWLEGADTAPRDRKITTVEIERALVKSWRESHPQDRDLSELRSRTEKAVSLRTSIEESAADPRGAHTPLGRLLINDVAKVLGRGTMAGTGIVPDQEFLEARLQQYAKELRVTVSPKWVEDTAREVHTGMTYARNLEAQMETIAGEIAAQLDLNTTELRVARGNLAITRGDDARAAASAAEDKKAMEMVMGALAAAAGPQAVKDIVAGKGKVPELTPQDQKRIQDNPSLSAPVKKMLTTPGAGYADIREKILDELIDKTAGGMAQQVEVNATRREADARALAANGIPPEARAQMQKAREEMAANLKKTGMPQAMIDQQLKVFDQSMGMTEQAYAAGATVPVPRLSRQEMARMMAESWNHDEGDTKRLGLSAAQQAEILKMRESIAGYSLDKSAAPTATGLLNAIKREQGAQQR